MRQSGYEHVARAARMTISTFVSAVPLLLGALLLAGLLTAFFSKVSLDGFVGIEGLPGAFIGALLGSLAAGHPMTSYVIGGELLSSGVDLMPVVALIVSWVTVGVVQFPAEAVSLGTKFALLRNTLCFLSAIAIAYLCAFTLPDVWS